MRKAYRSKPHTIELLFGQQRRPCGTDTLVCAADARANRGARATGGSNQPPFCRADASRGAAMRIQFEAARVATAQTRVSVPHGSAFLANCSSTVVESAKCLCGTPARFANLRPSPLPLPRPCFICYEGRE